jgi:alpha-ketoglutarate-dependent taurine dioxygenase
MVNCYITPGRNQTAWVHHVEQQGTPVADTGAFIESVYRRCESKPNTLYRHHWNNGDMVIYDNWFSVHRRDPIRLEDGEEDRLLKRLTFNI